MRKSLIFGLICALIISGMGNPTPSHAQDGFDFDVIETSVASDQSLEVSFSTNKAARCYVKIGETEYMAKSGEPEQASIENENYNGRILYSFKKENLPTNTDYYYALVCETANDIYFHDRVYVAPALYNRDLDLDIQIGRTHINRKNELVVKFHTRYLADCTVVINENSPDFVNSQPETALLLKTPRTSNNARFHYTIGFIDASRNIDYFYQIMCKYNDQSYTSPSYALAANSPDNEPEVQEVTEIVREVPSRRQPQRVSADAVNTTTTTTENSDRAKLKKRKRPEVVAERLDRRGRKVRDIKNNLGEKHRGKLFLQVQDRGRIWYINPEDSRRYEVTFANALALFEDLSLGITNEDLEKIQLSTDDIPVNQDSDSDGFTDVEEINNGFSPNGNKKFKYDRKLGQRLKGKILLQVQDRGRIWYVDFKGRRHEVTWRNLLRLFERLSTGITNDDLDQVSSVGVE